MKQGTAIVFDSSEVNVTEGLGVWGGVGQLQQVLLTWLLIPLAQIDPTQMMLLDVKGCFRSQRLRAKKPKKVFEDEGGWREDEGGFLSISCHEKSSEGQSEGGTVQEVEAGASICGNGGEERWEGGDFHQGTLASTGWRGEGGDEFDLHVHIWFRLPWVARIWMKMKWEMLWEARTKKKSDVRQWKSDGWRRWKWSRWDVWRVKRVRTMLFWWGPWHGSL